MVEEWSLAVIVGTGAAAADGKRMVVPTRFGAAGLASGSLGGVPVLFIARHGPGHRVPPHRIRYAAFAAALARLGCPRCVATAAVGSLREDWKPGTLVVPDDLLDLSGRGLTVHPEGIVHTDFTAPFGLGLRGKLLAAAPPARVLDGGTYVNVDGPRFETPGEIAMMRELGGDVVGMTAGSEAIVMREAGIAYAVVCVVTNLAAGLSETRVSHGDVYRAAKKPVKEIMGIFERLAASL
jgi:5'-methylthioadenosine phosphorylase